MVLIEKALALALTTSCVHVLHSQECLIYGPYMCATLSMYYIHKNVWGFLSMSVCKFVHVPLHSQECLRFSHVCVQLCPCTTFTRMSEVFCPCTTAFTRMPACCSSISVCNFVHVLALHSPQSALGSKHGSYHTSPQTPVHTPACNNNNTATWTTFAPNLQLGDFSSRATEYTKQNTHMFWLDPSDTRCQSFAHM